MKFLFLVQMLAEEFLESKQPVSEFIQTYKQQRKVRVWMDEMEVSVYCLSFSPPQLHHTRKTKYEKLVKGK